MHCKFLNHFLQFYLEINFISYNSEILDLQTLTVLFINFQTFCEFVCRYFFKKLNFILEFFLYQIIHFKLNFLNSLFFVKLCALNKMSLVIFYIIVYHFY